MNAIIPMGALSKKIDNVQSGFVRAEQIDNTHYDLHYADGTVIHAEFAKANPDGFIYTGNDEPTDHDKYPIWMPESEDAETFEDAVSEVLNEHKSEFVGFDNVKTINGQSIIGKGNIEIQGGGSGIKTVKDYGAVGDGTTDDTQAFINAITEQNGKPLYIPSGTYRLCECDISNLPINLVGVGNPTLKLKYSGTDYVGILNIHDAERIEISGITFDGERLEYAETHNLHCVWLYDCSNVYIHNCNFTNVSREAITVRGICKNVFIKNNTFDFTSALFWAYQGTLENLVFADNFAYNTRTHGVEIDTETTSSKITICGNHFENVAQSAFTFINCKDIKISGNYVKGSTYGFALFEANSIVENLDFSDNYIDATYCISIADKTTKLIKNSCFRNNKFIARGKNTMMRAGENIQFKDCLFDVIGSDSNYMFSVKNVTDLIVDNCIFTVDSDSTTTQIIYLDGTSNGKITNCNCDSKVKLFGSSSTSTLSFENVNGNVGSIDRAFKTGTRITSAINVTDTSSTIAQTSAVASTATELVYPKIGDIALVPLTGNRSISTVNTFNYNGRQITFSLNGWTLTLKNGGNIVTKSGSDSARSGFVSLLCMNDVWYEV